MVWIDEEQLEALEWCIKYYLDDNPDILGTPENGNTITTSHMTIGVMPGYNVENPTDDRVMELAECAKKKVDSILDGKAKEFCGNGHFMPDINLKPALTEYLPEWGCPKGGEKCVQLEIGPITKSYATLFAMGMQLALNQSTITLNFGDGENLCITRDEDITAFFSCKTPTSRPSTTNNADFFDVFSAAVD